MKEEEKSRLELVEEIHLLRKELIRARAQPLSHGSTGHRVLETAVEASLSAIAMATPAGEITYVNPAFMSMCGCSDRADVLGRSILSLSSEPATMEEILSTLKTGCGWVGELECRRRDGSALTVEMRACIVNDARDHPLCMMASFLDLTERKRAEAEKERLIAELKDALASIKTLKGLIPICSWCRKLKDDHGYWKQLEEYLTEQTGAELTHGMCPACYEKYLSGKLVTGGEGDTTDGDGEAGKSRKEDGSGT